MPQKGKREVQLFEKSLRELKVKKKRKGVQGLI